MNLTKAIGVFALLLLSQAVFAQKAGSSNTLSGAPTQTVTYVTPEAGATRVEQKVYQLLGTIKQNQDNPGSAAYLDAIVRDEYYRMVLAYLQEGYTATDAVYSAARKLQKGNPNIQLPLIITLTDEALVLLRV